MYLTSTQELEKDIFRNQSPRTRKTEVKPFNITIQTESFRLPKKGSVHTRANTWRYAFKAFPHCVLKASFDMRFIGKRARKVEHDVNAKDMSMLMTLM